jgi:stage III sporulation protein AB
MSDILRVIAGGILALISAYIGLLIKRGYSEKVQFYKGIVEFLGELRMDLAIMQTPLTQFVDNFVAGRKGKSVDLLKEYVADLKDKGRFVRDLERWDCAHLSRVEKEEVLHLFQSLGKTDLKEQKALVDNYERGMQDRQKKAADNLKKKGSTYFKLLVLLGIAIMVVLW